MQSELFHSLKAAVEPNKPHVLHEMTNEELAKCMLTAVLWPADTCCPFMEWLRHDVAPAAHALLWFLRFAGDRARGTEQTASENPRLARSVTYSMTYDLVLRTRRGFKALACSHPGR